MKILKGIPAAEGLGRGRIAVCDVSEAGSKDGRNLDEARKDCVSRMEVLYNKAKAEVNEEIADIFTVYMMLLEDRYLFEPIKKREEEGEDLPAVIEEEFEKTAAQFEGMKQEYMRQRADDIRAIKEMLLRSLKGEVKKFEFPDGDEKIILVAKELSPADTMQIEAEKIAGIVTEQGGVTSHSVILAKAMGIPAVIGVKNLKDLMCGLSAIVNGNTGTVVIEPDEVVMQEFDQEESAYGDTLKKWEEAERKPAVTLDGYEMKVCINAGISSDFQEGNTHCCDGIGLLRTEFLYTDRESLPKLEEQKQYYRNAFTFANGKSMVIRSLDIGGDKAVPYLKLPEEENPFLGNRGIRLCLNQESLLRSQMEALLEAADGRSFSLMFPMVTNLTEILRAKAIFEEMKGKTQKKGYRISEEIKLGIMIETPAAAIMADVLAKYVDFMSIGTNDLTQYIMAADRGNVAVQNLYNHYNPAVIRMIWHTARACSTEGIEVSVCGEAASDTQFLFLLAGMGIRKVSVGSSLVGQVKHNICTMKIDSIADKIHEILNMEDALQIQERMRYLKNE